jgi:probable rRNA maturation factor
MTKRARGRAKAAPIIDVIVESARWKKQPRAASIVKKAVTMAAKATSTPRPELAIVLTDDSTIRALNGQWRGLDTPTNVLSFAAQHGRQAPRQMRSFGHLGDIIIAYQTTAREAKAEEKPFRHHLAHLAVHGFLHLLGYDHGTDRDAKAMERLETRILRRLGVPDPYIAHQIEH